jgi:hypothetical protein
MGIDGENNYNFVWFKDGWVSAGSSENLGKYRKPYEYQLPLNPDTNKPYRPKDIVGMGVDGENNYNFVWFRNGWVSAGSSEDLGKYRKPYEYQLPLNPETNKPYRPQDIIGMGIDGENNYNFVWYKDGRVSAGTSEDLGKYRKPYKIERAPAVNVQPNDVVGMGIDGENNWIFVWFVGKDSKLC